MTAVARPIVLADDDHVAIVLKPAGIALRHPARGECLSAWARSKLPQSSFSDGLQPVVVSPLSLAGVAGPVCIAKTRRAEAALLSGSRKTQCTYMALLTSLPDSTEEVDVEEVSSVHAATFETLSLVKLHTTAAVDVQELCRRLPILGGVERFPGGVHLALTQLSLPPEFVQLRGADACSVFASEVPKKLAKTMHRESLHSLRRQKLQHEQLGAGTITFCGLTFIIPAGQLQPRPSSECLVHAAVREGISLGPAPRILDLGCGCGALMLAALHILRTMRCDAAVCGIDNDASALLAARSNARSILGDFDPDTVQLLSADFGTLHEPFVRNRLPRDGFEVIVCNPPYLRNAAGGGRTTVESGAALYAGRDGLDAYRAVVSSLVLADPPILRRGEREGVLLLQLPASSRALRSVVALCESNGLRVCGEPLTDNRGVPRCLVVRWM